MTSMGFMAWAFLLAPLVVTLVAIANRRAPMSLEVRRARWQWPLSCGLFWLASIAVALSTLRRSGDVALLFTWASLVAGSIALAEGYETQQVRKATGRSRWSPGLLIVFGVAGSLFHPILLGVASLLPQWRVWADDRDRSAT
jgi:hypothetical protein